MTAVIWPNSVIVAIASDRQLLADKLPMPCRG